MSINPKCESNNYANTCDTNIDGLQNCSQRQYQSGQKVE